MILEGADHRFCHREEEPHLPSPFHPRVARGASPHPRLAIGVVPRSRPGAECLPRGLTWARNPRAFRRQYQTRQDPFRRACTTEAPQQRWGPPGPPSPETEVLPLEQALHARTPRAPPLRSPGPLCPPPQVGPWMTSPLHHLLPWATGRPSTEKRCPLLLLHHRTANLQCLPPRGPGPGARHHLLRHRPAGPGLLRCPRLPAMRSRGCHSGTCPSRPLRLPCLHPDARGLSLLRPTRGPLRQ